MNGRINCLRKTSYIPTAVLLKTQVFWVPMLCRWFSVSRPFEETCVCIFNDCCA